MNPDWYQWQEQDLLLRCTLKPRAGGDGILGLRHRRLHVQVKAPPVDGKANTALCHYLAREFGVAKQHAELRSGASARQKTIVVRQPGQLPGWFHELSRQSSAIK